MSLSTPIYRIKIAGQLTPNWGAHLGGLTVITEAEQTILMGPIVDQAALHGLLQQVRDLGLTLLLVEKIDSSEYQMEIKVIKQ